MTVALLGDGTEVEVCDGCGRQDAGPGMPLDTSAYTVVDPNVGTAVRHHYCPSCAYDRGSTATELLEFGWQPAPLPPADEEDTPRRSRR
jgi:hypothetical protein